MSWKNRKRSAADAADDDDNTGAMSADSGSQPVGVLGGAWLLINVEPVVVDMVLLPRCSGVLAV